MTVTERFRPYLKYKESGIGWIGKIPYEWEIIRLKFMIKTVLKYGANEPAEYEDKELPRYIRITDIEENGKLREETFKSLPEEIAKDYILKDGDILFARSGATVGKTFIYDKSWGRAAFAGYLIKASIKKKKYLPQYIYKFTKSYCYEAWLKTIFIQSTIQNISAEKYANLFITLPNLKEQSQIAAFLDHETSRIDSLIDKKQQQIDLLQEKRSALITHAVTKGLNPDVRMKDSGIDRIKKIPHNWNHMKLKFSVIKIGSGKTPKGGAEIYVDTGIMLIRSQNVHFKGLVLDDIVHINETIDREMSSTRVKENDILLNITGASIGRVCLFKSKKSANVNQHVCIIRPKRKVINPTFLFYSISSDLIQSQIMSSQNGTSREGLNFQQIGNLLVIFPSTLTEQIQIVDYLNQETGKIDRLIDKINTSIEKLREFRAAMITAAVTGKIDVRNWDKGETS